MVVFFIFDEYTDNTDRDGACACADLVMDVLQNPDVERPQGESKLGEITRQYVWPSCVYFFLSKLNVVSSS